jgi:8-oxo-dGTP pyrophosphatase MutT (NUDIX family)
VGFIEDLAARLKQPLPGAEAQLRLSPRSPGSRPLARVPPPTVRHAAALILLYQRHGLAGAPAEAGGWTMPLTIRRHDLLHHPGQISLPGGGIDEGELPEAASLREAEEEIGVDPSTVRVLGALTPLYVIVSGNLVTPFVGVVAERPVFRPDTSEVEDVIEVPLSHFKDPSRLMWGNRTREGYLIDFPYYLVGDPPVHQVWGATAMILAEFVRLIE